MNDENEDLCTTVVKKMSTVQILSQVSQFVSQCQVSQCSPEELCQVLPFCDDILSEMKRIVSDVSMYQQQQTAVSDSDAQLWWDSSHDPEHSSDVSSCSSSSISSSLFELSPASPMFQSIDVGDLFVSSLTEFIGKVSPNNSYSPAKARNLRRKRRKQQLRKLISRELWSVYQNVEEIIAPKRVPVNTKLVPDVIAKVNWSQVNHRFLSNIPSPKKYPVLGCSPDPSFYQDTMELINKGTINQTWFTHQCKFGNIDFPYGYEMCFSTDKGPISARGVQVHGHVWDDSVGWTLHADLVSSGDSVQETRTSRTHRDRGQRQKRWKKR